MQARGFSYTTLVDPDYADGVQMYQADDLACSGLSRPANQIRDHHIQGREHRGDGDSQVAGGQRRHASACWSSITALDTKYADLRVIDDEDIPRIEGRARQLQRRAHRKIATALGRARNGWEAFLLSFAQVKRRSGGVSGPCFY
ncbi:hypothetical protein GGF44_000029 [Coemansia sp. RSA 1694]|nr:hypothetical protein GGF44_000029 [Coemansia sp. RSA 1694]